jgi:hypothetical protein
VGRVPEAVEALAAVRGPLERAIAEAGGITDFAGVWNDVASGRTQVFATGKSILLAEVQQYRLAKVLQLCYGAGALDEMEPWFDTVLEWGRAQGCSKVVMLGRRGWERTFLGNRLRPTHVLMEGSL